MTINVFIKTVKNPQHLIIHSEIGPISFPEHARSQVKGGHSSGEIELIQACDWLTTDNTLDFQREFYINKVFGISRRKFDTFYTEID